ncbi:MAG: MbcA/ParS/Xre antitoxin family protein [Alphaproteobacteria bacterium]|nr:MbcA/ParS/Xre antitoxin family protein [Alphaproteobacteria bacterium]MCD8526220.1 MbcA/ParS/Xre antitoxin family protein [Alphaproteobacteria bacterium]MCD8570762.1 MbcA/ParS/Xre antitoxin family protein [Alphaproteobacteria bacterium]
MALKDDISGLKAAYLKVAESIKAELPDVWDAAVRACCRDEDTALNILIKPNMFLEGGVPLEMILESPEKKEQVLHYLAGLEYGVGL